eukprot:282352-Rhodomonas_salina.2
MKESRQEKVEELNCSRLPEERLRSVKINVRFSNQKTDGRSEDLGKVQDLKPGSSPRGWRGGWHCRPTEKEQCCPGAVCPGKY